MELLAKLPLKTKLIIAGAFGSVAVTIFMILILLAPLIEVGIIDAEPQGSSPINLAYSSISASSSFWWPIGSEETTEEDGVTFAKDTPVETEILSSFEDTNNSGIDIKALGYSENEVNIIASKDGTVIYPGEEDKTDCESSTSEDDTCGDGYGNYVMIEHSDGTVTLYGNLYEKSITVKSGDTVKQGQVIGKMGSSGSCSEMQLRFEIRLNGNNVDPENYVDLKDPRPIGKFNIGSISSSGSPEENKSAICQALLSAGYSKNATAGMLVNISTEGGFETSNMEDCYEAGQCCNFGGPYGMCTKSASDPLRNFANDIDYTNGVDSGAYPRENFVNDRVGYGLIQWTPDDRKGRLYDYVKKSNESISSLNAQFNYLLEEIRDYYPTTADAISDETKTAYDVARIFCLNFESPHAKESTCPARASENSEVYLNYVNNGCQ